MLVNTEIFEEFLETFIPNLQIRLKEKMELERPDGTKAIQVEVYSVRDGKEFLLRYESEGIKRIISILKHILIQTDYCKPYKIIKRKNSNRS